MKQDDSRDLLGAQLDADNTNNFQSRSSAFYGNRNALEKRILEEREQDALLGDKVKNTEEFLLLSKAAGDRTPPLSISDFEKRKAQERQTDTARSVNSPKTLNATYKPHDQVNRERDEEIAREQAKYEAAYQRRKEYEQQHEKNNAKPLKLTSNPCYHSPTKKVGAANSGQLSSTALSNSVTDTNANINVSSAVMNATLNNLGQQQQHQQQI